MHEYTPTFRNEIAQNPNVAVIMDKMSQLLNKFTHLFRSFGGSIIISILALVFVYFYLGWQAALVTLALMVIEVTFSFDNAIVNAKVLNTMSAFWQHIFMTIGILVAVFGMRIIFPILVVMLSANLPWGEVLHLALNNPKEYAAALNGAHTSIASFGGMFLLMLALHFLFDKERSVRWLGVIERPMQKVGHWWMPMAVSAVVLAVVTMLPANHHPKDTLIAGVVGVVTYLTISGLSAFFTKQHEKTEKLAGKKLLKTGMAGFSAFIYLEVLDASFSLDGVIGAFAVTQNVILIAVGLGVGAVWVRSMTLYMVRHKVLHAYPYIEHGAHYTIGVLAIILLFSLFFGIPEAIAGGIGVLIITASIVASKKADKTTVTI
ncbi:MAG: hypothetical protein JWO55_74 [Candidatus Saccharibacteria bacterium]|jgi:hypothetical protein|nr:hypothetical protein [Candidatus Saccharibacteria bacterium]